MSRRIDMPRRNRIVPLRVFISVQSGRQHLLAYLPEYNSFHAYRVDYLSNVKLEDPTPRFDELRAELDRMQSKMWGVSVKRNKWGNDHLEHVEFTIKIEDNEEYIVRRLERENEELQQKVRELESYIDGVQVGLRANKRINIVNHGGQA